MRSRVLSLFFLFLAVDSFAYSGSTDFLLSTTAANTSSASFNSDNSLLQTPRYKADAELRPDYQWQIDDSKKIIFRGRWLGTFTEVKSGNPEETKDRTIGKLDLTDLFYSWIVDDRWQTHIGLQNYQWGPAELLSPSNPIFHFNTNQKSFFYKEKGHNIFRLAYDQSAEWHWLFLSEFLSNNEPYWIDGRDFEPKSLIKLERSLTKATDYIAIVIGSEETHLPFVGGYFSYEIVDGFSFYVDTRWTHGHWRYDAYSLTNGFKQIQVSEDRESIENLSLIGMRYENEHWDTRLEYVQNSNGFSRDQFASVLNSVTTISPYLASNLSHFSHSGRELLGRDYLYLSLRNTEFFRKKDLTFYLRDLVNLTDSSGLVQADFDYPINNSTISYFEYNLFYGSKDSEFTFSERERLALGLKITLD